MSGVGWKQDFAIGGRSFPYGATLIVAALLYFLCARLGLAFATLQESASPVWPASGFAVALLIVAGPRAWPAVALGAFSANVLTGGVLSAGFITLGNTAEALAGMWLFNRISAINPGYLPIARSSGFVLAALSAPLASAGVGVLTLLGLDALGDSGAGGVFVTWWAGDMLGILLLAPALVAIQFRTGGQTSSEALADRPRDLRFLRLRRIVIIGALAFGSTAMAFTGSDWAGAFILAFPVILLGARWFGSRGSTLTLLLIAALWLAGTLHGISHGDMSGAGPFADRTANDALLNMQIMLAALVYALVRNANQPESHPLMWPMFVCWGVLLLLCRPVRKSSNLLTIIYLLAPPLVVAVLGAINAGLK